MRQLPVTLKDNIIRFMHIADIGKIPEKKMKSFESEIPKVSQYPSKQPETATVYLFQNSVQKG